MESMMEIIQRRTSIRTYEHRSIETNKKEALREFLLSNQTGPLGSTVRFDLVQADESDRNSLKELGTYGNIQGAFLYIAGAVKKGPKAMEDFGFCMEKNILKATEIGFGTCWLGGFLNRSAFAAKINAEADELIPAVTPVGYPAEKRSLFDKTVRFVAGSKKRKDFKELFFQGSIRQPLEMENDNPYHSSLEAVRLAPSASNKQPWRIIKEAGGNVFHFYLNENPFYNQRFGEIRIQNLDMGIAMCHFEFTARDQALKGSWQISDPGLETNGLQYIVSWCG